MGLDRGNLAGGLQVTTFQKWKVGEKGDLDRSTRNMVEVSVVKVLEMGG